MMLMDTFIIGGTPSSGKTAAILRVLALTGGPARPGIVKLDCIETDDDAVFRRHGFPAIAMLAGRICPDHCLMERFPEATAWAAGEGLTMLVVETAGLCGRCAPYRVDAGAVCVIDCTAGVDAPRKLGPHLADADVCVVTRGDLVSQTEREVFVHGVRTRNPRAPIVWLNGLTGEGASSLAAALRGLTARGRRLQATVVPGPRTPLPQMYCSYCFGRSEIGLTTY